VTKSTEGGRRRRLTISRLALSHNPSVALPSQIVDCERIRYLNIRWNDLDRFPEVVR